MILLSVVFITFIPSMLNAGNKIGTIKNIFSDVFKLRLGREQIGPLFSRYAIKISANATRLNEIKREVVDNGLSYPRLSDKLFNNKPKNIKKAMLIPQLNINFSKKSILFNFRSCRINNPGKIVRKRNPNICLKNGMSKRITMSVIISVVIEI